MEITGRLTGDATVKTLNGERKVVNFSIAINDSYRSGGEQKKITTFFDCSYWLNTGIAEYLKKGGWVQIYGRVGVNAYINGGGEAKASLTFHTTEVKLLGAVVTVSSNSSRNKGATVSSRNPNGSAGENVKGVGVQIVPTDTFDGLEGDLPF
ncbi:MULTISPECIES: single-stranded DNA-binding protein [Pedobacter]|uniref:Single-stranded DNA-binding protein n=1 Tax=Pedobacter suwonensis TaxID=332999 RepID=A0A1I0TTK0_9SPHI|nr:MULTISPECIES: single-stranded DNA-binding protein [Pedobacter]SFA55109.1 single-strand DNA-binding protein [Pedobacter suwonensis]